jgi:lipopolysaccharide export LptBFGC system permease protein LptF
MKRTNSFGKVILVTILFSAVMAVGIKLLEELIGADKVFIWAICLLPVVFIWMLITDALVKRSNKKKG